MALGAAVCAAVVTGALLVGDSVRGSLRDLALDRLGRIQWVVLSESFVREDAPAALGTPAGPPVPVILIPATVTHATSGARAEEAALIGLDERFDALFAAGPAVGRMVSAASGGLPAIVVNGALEAQLAAREGDQVLVTVPLPSLAPAESAMGRRDLERASLTLRAVVAGVAPASGAGRFALTAEQALRPAAFLSVADLQRGLQQPGRVNAWLLSGSHEAAALETDLARALDLNDRGLSVTPREGFVSIEARTFVMPPGTAAALEAIAAEAGGTVQRVRTTVAVSLRAVSTGREIPYSTITAIDPVHASLPGLTLVEGAPATRLTGGEILLGEWAARDLGARPGDALDVETFLLDDAGHLSTRTDRFRLAGVVSAAGAGSDRTLTPTYPGIQEARHIVDWDPPFPVNLRRVRPADETYWDVYGATPKAFVAEADGARFWGGRQGSITALRVVPPAGMSAEGMARRLDELFRSRVPLDLTGLRARPVREEALRGAAGSTDFGALFGGLSAFLIVSGALLAGLLFGLGVERRSREIGVLRAIGYPLRRVRRQFLAEGSALAGLGLLVGLPASAAYAALLMLGLRGAWSGAVGTSALWLHVRPMSFVVGGAIGLAAVMLAILATLRRILRIEPAMLLAGAGVGEGDGRGSGRVALAVAILGLGGAGALAALQVADQEAASPGLALGAGACALASAIAWFAWWAAAAGRGRPLTPGMGSVLRLAARNAAWNPGRSVLSVTLIASACFILAVVAGGAGHADDPGRSGGTGGFTLVAHSTLPLHADPGSSAGRSELGLPEEITGALQGVTLMSLRAVPGDDISCLNLFQPQRPRLVGATERLISRGGFRFAATQEESDNPWELLARPLEPGVIPAIGDASSVQWILHLGLGQDLVVRDEMGQDVRLRFVALLSGSLFQSEVVIHERDLLAHFPSRAGRSFFLLETPPGREQAVATVLEEALAREGFDAEPTAQRLARYREVERTYLSTFQVLGGLGLLLGTCGLGIITARSLLERRAELAALRAFGFPRRRLRAMILAETAVLVVLGATLGSAAALLALAPRVVSGAARVAWGPLAMTLLLVVIVGVAASVAATAAVLRAPLLPALRSDR